MYDIFAKSMITAARADLHAIGSPAARQARPVADNVTVTDITLEAGAGGRKPVYRLSRMARNLFAS
ncbi:MAG: hypothetical protein ACMVY4_13655 [Minwuia sp.]|uniref:hypothetical protein n=1 Tax=Minwuia sp. TaxID=2493630 RepID=UPI003A8714E3